MVIEVDPGTSGKIPAEGSTIPLAQTAPNVQPDEILATLDTDTREYLALLLEGGGRGLGGNGKQLSAGLRRFEPFTRDLGADRQGARGAQAEHPPLDPQLPPDRRGAGPQRCRPGPLRRLHQRGARSLRKPASRASGVAGELPPTLRAAQSGLEKSSQLSRVLRPALLALIPSAVDLKPALEATQETFRETTVPIRDQIRPFTRKIRPDAPPPVPGRGAAEEDRRRA